MRQFTFPLDELIEITDELVDLFNYFDKNIDKFCYDAWIVSMYDKNTISEYIRYYIDNKNKL